MTEDAGRVFGITVRRHDYAPLFPPHPIIWLIKIGMNEGDGCPQSARLPTARCPYFQEDNITTTCGIR